MKVSTADIYEITKTMQDLEMLKYRAVELMKAKQSELKFNDGAEINGYETTIDLDKELSEELSKFLVSWYDKKLNDKMEKLRRVVG